MTVERSTPTRRKTAHSEETATYLTMHSAPAWGLCPSSMRTLTSRSAVDGTPSSSSSRRIFFNATTCPV